jgi:RNA 2',3'-cyclic 3'-phosphodiesterase
MRLFVALEVAPEVRRRLDEALAAVRRDHSGLRWTPAEQWHLTIAFIGEVATAPEDVADVLRPAAADATAIRLALSAPGRFGDRILWYGVRDEPEGAVSGLGAAVQADLARSGLPVDEKPVHPHVTLARGGRKGGKIRSSIVDAVPAQSGEWTAGEILVVASVPQADGPNRYVTQASVPLGDQRA